MATWCCLRYLKLLINRFLCLAVARATQSSHTFTHNNTQSHTSTHNCTHSHTITQSHAQFHTITKEITTKWGGGCKLNLNAHLIRFPKYFLACLGALHFVAFELGGCTQSSLTPLYGTITCEPTHTIASAFAIDFLIVL